jgi:epoxide hydrolase-like predicted phosphatase
MFEDCGWVVEKMIKAIIFDIGGVMASENNLKDHYEPLCKALKIDKKEFFRLRDKYVSKSACGKISGKEMIKKFAKELNINYGFLLKNWIKYKIKSIRKNIKLEKIIKRLKKNGYRIASLSNVLDIHYELCNKKHIYDVFDFNIVSFKEGISKPDKRIYKLLLKKLKMKGKEVVFIDDYQICLDGAKKLGITTILFKNNKQLAKDLKKFGVKVR